MQSTRLEKIARLLQKELSEIFRLETAKMGGVLVSVSAVRVSPDLSIARAYLSVFPSERAQEIMANINANERAFATIWLSVCATNSAKRLSCTSISTIRSTISSTSTNCWLKTAQRLIKLRNNSHP